MAQLLNFTTLEHGMNQSANFWDYLDTPLGKVKVSASTTGITSVVFTKPQDQFIDTIPNALVTAACDQLRQYFDGKRNEFNLELDLIGTEFQRQVWQSLLTIPYGQTCSYSEIAKQLSNPKAVRAVGAANGKNPVSIIVPCHRVIGANGTLTGYAGGLSRKEWLLNLESPKCGEL
jgi:methylated-DNA-[protein]-cysteine S-methyltransferase